MKNKLGLVVLLIIVAVISAGITRYYFPQIEFKNVEVTKEIVRNDIKTIVKTIEHKDGTKETIEERIDKSIKQESTSSETVITKKNDWMLDISLRQNSISKLTESPVYELQVQRRILGPFFVGAKASTDQSFGLSLGMEF